MNFKSQLYDLTPLLTEALDSAAYLSVHKIKVEVFDDWSVGVSVCWEETLGGPCSRLVNVKAKMVMFRSISCTFLDQGIQIAKKCKSSPSLSVCLSLWLSVCLSVSLCLCVSMSLSLCGVSNDVCMQTQAPRDDIKCDATMLIITLKITENKFTGNK